jgi:hypothetical protein
MVGDESNIYWVRIGVGFGGFDGVQETGIGGAVVATETQQD